MTEIRPLSWGRHYLMCRPEHFRVDYAINPWMDVDAPVDPDLALAQWDCWSRPSSRPVRRSSA